VAGKDYRHFCLALDPNALYSYCDTSPSFRRHSSAHSQSIPYWTKVQYTYFEIALKRLASRSEENASMMTDSLGESEKLFKQREKNMQRRNLTKIAYGLAIAAFAAGCAAQYQANEAALQQPINCATAEGDIRVLQGEKTNAAQQAAAGATAIAPAGIVMGLVTGTENTKLQVATGEYNKMIDSKISDIRRTCRM
jgi:hypothetical protein